MLDVSLVDRPVEVASFCSSDPCPFLPLVAALSSLAPALSSLAPAFFSPAPASVVPVAASSLAPASASLAPAFVSPSSPSLAVFGLARGAQRDVQGTRQQWRHEGQDAWQ